MFPKSTRRPCRCRMHLLPRCMLPGPTSGRSRLQPRVGASSSSSRGAFRHLFRHCRSPTRRMGSRGNRSLVFCIQNSETSRRRQAAVGRVTTTVGRVATRSVSRPQTGSRYGAGAPTRPTTVGRVATKERIETTNGVSIRRWRAYSTDESPGPRYGAGAPTRPTTLSVRAPACSSSSSMRRAISA